MELGNKGFTLIEVLLVLFLFAVISGILMPSYLTFQKKNDLEIAGTSYTTALRRSQVLSRAVQDDSSWGVKLLSGSIIIFKGNDYQNRDQSFDEKFNISPEVAFTGNDEIIFLKGNGDPNLFGPTTLSIGNNSKVITLNEIGTINY